MLVILRPLGKCRSNLLLIRRISSFLLYYILQLHSTSRFVIFEAGTNWRSSGNHEVDTQEREEIRRGILRCERKALGSRCITLFKSLYTGRTDAQSLL